MIHVPLAEQLIYFCRLVVHIIRMFKIYHNLNLCSAWVDFLRFNEYQLHFVYLAIHIKFFKRPTRPKCDFVDSQP